MSYEKTMKLKTIAKAINKLEPKKKKLLIELIKKLQRLRELGQTDNEIDHAINKLDLDLKYHLFIKGNFSELMTLKFN